MGLKSLIGDKIKGGRANRNALIVEATHPTNLCAEICLMVNLASNSGRKIVHISSNDWIESIHQSQT